MVIILFYNIEMTTLWESLRFEKVFSPLNVYVVLSFINLVHKFQLFYCNSYSSTVEINVDIDCSSIPSKYIKSSETKERYFE